MLRTLVIIGASFASILSYGDFAGQIAKIQGDWSFSGNNQNKLIMTFLKHGADKVQVHACPDSSVQKAGSCRNAVAKLASYDSGSDSFCRRAYRGAEACTLRYRVGSDGGLIEVLLDGEKIYKNSGKKI